MWDKLSMKEKAAFIRTAVKNGVYNLDDIRNRYNEFAMGGETDTNTGPYVAHPVTVSDTPLTTIRKRLYENITPFGYENPISRVFNALVKNEQDNSRQGENVLIESKDPQASTLDAIWATYLNIPEEDRRKIDSNYGITKTPEGYYKLNNPDMAFDFDYNLSDKGLYHSPSRVIRMNGILGNYTIGRDRDDRGDYIYYSDSSLDNNNTPDIKTGWDINPYSNTADDITDETTEEHGIYGQDRKGLTYNIGKYLFGNVEDISMGIGTPVPIYDKIYLDDYYDTPEGERGAHYLPEITVNADRKALGGHIYDGLTEESQQMETYTAPWVIGAKEREARRKSWLDIQASKYAQAVEDAKHPTGHYMNELVVTPNGTSLGSVSSEAMLDNLLSSTRERQAKDRRDASNMVRHIHEGTDTAAKALYPLITAPVLAPLSSAVAAADVPGALTSTLVNPWTRAGLKFMGRPTSSFTEGLSYYLPQVSKAVPYMEGLDRSLMGTLGLAGMWDAGKGVVTGAKPWYEAGLEGALSGAMATELYPAAKGITLATKNGLEKLSNGIRGGYTTTKKFINDAYLGGIKDIYKKLYNLDATINFDSGREDAYLERMARGAQQELDKFRDLIYKVYNPRTKIFSDVWPDEAKIGRNQRKVNFEKMSDENILKFFTGKVDNPTKVAKSYDRSRGIFEMEEFAPRAFNPEEAVTTGNVEIKDIETGKVNKFNLSLGDGKSTGKSVRTTYTPKGTPKRAEGISSQNINNVAAKLNPEAPREYTEAIQKNMDYVSNTILPGSRPFGSSTNIAKGNLVHGSHDIDVIMTEAQAKKHEDFKNFYEKIEGATYGYNHPQAGEIDINIIREKGGKAYGQRAHELYAQLHPKEYRDIMMSYAKRGKTLTTDLPLNKTADELLNEYNPVTKGIMDAFGSGKSKHMKRAIYYLHYGDLADVRKGFDSYANYLLGGEYKPSDIPLEEFSNSEVNSKLIDELGLTAINKEQFVNDPERMKLLFDYAMLDKTFVGRGVDKDVVKSLTYWYPENNGGTAMGVGLNTVRGGNSNYGSVYGTLIPERMPQPTSLSPMENIEKLKINRELEPEEIAKVIDLGNKHNIPLSENDLHDFTSVLRQTQGREGKNYKKFIAELAKEFDIPLIENSTFGNAPYASLLEDQPEEAIKQLILHGMDRPTPAAVRDREAFSNVRTDFGRDLREAREAVGKREMLITKSRMPEQSLAHQLASKISKDKKEAVIQARVKAMKDWGEQGLSHQALYNELQKNVSKYARRIKLIRNIVDGAAIGALVGTGFKLGAKALNSYGRKRDAKRNREEYEREIERRKQGELQLMMRDHSYFERRLGEYKSKN